MPVSNIIKALDSDDRFIEVPDCSRDDLPALFKHLGFKVGAEVGVYKGEFTRKLLEGGMKVYGVDPWRVYDDYSNPKGQERLDFQCEHTKRYLDEYIKNGQCEIVRKTSMEALNDFKDGSLDFVYIDANHLLKYVVEDIVGWAEKVKKDGIVSGHDYFKCAGTRKHNSIHVQYAVDAYVGSYFVNKLYVLGARNHQEGLIRDKWRSWMFFKDYPLTSKEVIT